MPTAVTSPASLAPELDRVLARLGLQGKRRLSANLLRYLELLQRWNAAYNLTSIRDPAQMLTQHVADCLSVVAPLRAKLPTRVPVRLLDVGSGAGLPGIMIAITCPDIQVVCIDAVGKKAAFLQQVVSELRPPNARALHGRVERLQEPPFDVVTSRAFSSLWDFVTLTRPMLRPDGVWMAMKGKRPDEEMAELPPAVSVFHVEPIDVPELPAERCLIWMRPSS